MSELNDLQTQSESDKKTILALTKQAKAAEENLRSAKEQIDQLTDAVAEAEARPSGTVDAATQAPATEEVEHKLGNVFCFVLTSMPSGVGHSAICICLTRHKIKRTLVLIWRRLDEDIEAFQTKRLDLVTSRCTTIHYRKF